MSLHTRSENAEYQSTEWDEAQKKYGNIEGPLGPERLRNDIQAEKEDIEQLRAQEETERVKALESKAMGSEFEDAETEEDEKFMKEYRQRRMEEMRNEAKKGKYGSVLDITADSFRQEVTDAADGELRVVVHLFRDGLEDCDIVDRILVNLAKKNPRTKFTRIFFSNAIPNYPESNLPTILVYYDHDIIFQLVTLKMLGGIRALMSNQGEDILAAALSHSGAVQAPSQEKKMSGDKDGSDEDSD